jgi:hypothetical protein
MFIEGLSKWLPEKAEIFSGYATEYIDHDLSEIPHVQIKIHSIPYFI